MHSIQFTDDQFGTIREQAAAAGYDDLATFVEHLAESRRSKPSAKGSPLVDQFREFRGMLKGASLDEIVDSRHAGLP